MNRNINKRIEGTIAEMVEEALAFCKRNMKTRTIIDSQTGRRTDQTEYLINALREAILNALIHRDYSSYTEGTPVQLDLTACIPGKFGFDRILTGVLQ